MLKFVESRVQRKALLVMTGSATETSFLDKFGFPGGFCELRSTQYSISQSRIRSCEFVETLPVTRIGEEKRLLFNLAATRYSELFTVETNLDDAMLISDSLDGSADISVNSAANVTSQSLSLHLTKDRLHQYLCKFIYVIFYYFISYFLYFQMVLMVISTG